MSQEIIFTTLPNGRIEIEGNKYLKLSVFTTIQVKTPGDSTLSKFEDILNWPDKLLSAQYKFLMNNTILTDATLDAVKIDAALYKNIFHKDIRLKGYIQENFNQIHINSFPSKNVKEYLLKNYLQTAIESPTRLVTAEKFIDEERFGVISQYKIDEKEFEKINSLQRTEPVKVSKLMVKRTDETVRLKDNIRNLRFTPASKKMNPSFDFALFRNFHRTEKWKRTVEPVKLKKPEFEFHEIVAILNSYPQLMRRMGFILDFIIPYTDGLIKTGGINLMPSSLTFTEPDTIVTVPQTAYLITDKGFFTDDKDNSIFKSGFAKINTDEFSVIQIDADGAAIKAHNLAENKAQQVARYLTQKSNRSVFKINPGTEEIEQVEPPEDEGLPFIRSAGIAVTKNGMAEHIFNSIEGNVKLHNTLISLTPENTVMVPGLRLKLPDNKLYSADIMQGYRMDIAYENDPEKWYSLHRRKDQYSWYDEGSNSHPVDNIEPDEGYIELGIAEDPDDPSDVFVSDTIARWEGWSLAVGKLGFAINHADDRETPPEDGIKRDFVHTSKASEIKKYAFDPDLHFRVNVQSMIVPGTLPKLRFGKDYRIRIRAVDLAGNSLPVSAETSDPLLTIQKNIRYLRYEPITSPIVMVGNELKDGEFLERLVIRSNYDQTTAEYENSHKVADKLFDSFSQRYLLPPKNSQAMAETHGMLEKAFSGNPDAAKEIYQIIASHEGMYKREDSTAEKVYQPSEVEVIYLPDPMAAGVAFFITEGYETSHSQEFFNPRLFAFYSNGEIMADNTNTEIPIDWYNAKAVRIRLEEGELETKWNVPERILTVFLPKGYRTRIRFSTFWREQDIKQISAIWDMIREQSPANLAELEKLMVTGRHWMISPSREFELVHATQQPVTEPVLQALIPVRDFDDTTADINTRFSVHGESTDKVEIQARWTEPLDDGISVTIKDTEGRNSIPDITVHYHDDVITKGTIPDLSKIELKENPKLLYQPHYELKARTKNEFRANPQPEAARIGKYYKTQAEGFDKLQAANFSVSKSVVDRLRFDIEASKFSFLRNINLRLLPLKQNFGDTKHRWVDYNVQATTRYREYFDKILVQKKKLPIVQESKWIEQVNILSSARPKAPEIDYIIPTFEWCKTQNENTIQHRRLGGGLRVYLKRPWFSSGIDEMLGVILPPVQEDKKIQTAQISSLSFQKLSYTPYYTHWGLDPLHLSTKPDTFSPSREDFRLNPVGEDNLQYPDPKGLRAGVVGYPVQFDEDRQMWYCDLAVNPGNMYFPFIRLVLARYQKHSVRKGSDDVCLSPPVFADMIQLMPDRTATLIFKNDESNSKFTLTIEGVIYNGLNRESRNTDSVLRISFNNSRLAQPLYGLIDDATTPKILTDQAFEISISPKDISNNRFSISHDFKLPREYKEVPFEILIREFEQIPQKTRDVDSLYNDRLERSPETDKLIYADVFKINSTK
ncbi:MAG: hypothetical protein WCS03_15730 [Bacteroidota bacterium]